jgi:hypothetical protein
VCWVTEESATCGRFAFEVGRGMGYLKQKVTPNGILVITIGFHRVSGSFLLDSSCNS